MMEPGPALDAARAVVETAAVRAGREAEAIGMEGRVSYRGDIDEIGAAVAAWSDTGASHLSINTMGAGLAGVDEHLAVLTEIAERSL
jgi:hypothetical protein